MPVIDLSMGGGISSHAARRRSARLQRRESVRQRAQEQTNAAQGVPGDNAEDISGAENSQSILYAIERP